MNSNGQGPPRKRVVLVVEDDRPIGELLASIINDEEGYVAIHVTGDIGSSTGQGATINVPLFKIAVYTLAWIVAAVLAFTVPALQSWRPVTVAGLGLAAFGTSVFLWQRRAARSGSRGAQTGLR